MSSLCQLGTATILLAASIGAQSRSASPARDWFRDGEIPRLRLTLLPADRARLQKHPKSYVRATLRDGTGQVIPAAGLEVAVKLKGSAGSFRRLDDKPGWTVDVNRFRPGQAYRGLVKFHLNNAVQDASYLHEFLAYEVFRLAGLPSPRVTHARVSLDDRDLGLYVLKEGYDRRFLRRCFGRAGGNLYDGGVNGEVDHDLDRDSGKGPVDRRDLKALAAACALPPGAERRRHLAESLDIERFLTFMAAEVMVGHWDGYTRNPNNYRIHFPRATGKAVFLVHGADQVFQQPDYGLFDRAGGKVAAKVLEEPEWRRAYERRLAQLLPLFAPPKLLLERVRRKAARVEPVIQATMSPEFYRGWMKARADLERRVVARSQYLVTAVREGWPKPLVVPAEGFALGARPWGTRQDCADVKFGGNDGKRATALTIRAAHCGSCVGSFRTSLLLPRGKYELRAEISTTGVKVASKNYNPGAGIRISGGRRNWVLAGTVRNRKVRFPFEVRAETQRVVVIVELRAAQGHAVFPKNALSLHRRK